MTNAIQPKSRARNDMQIPGGYYIKARKIQESEIAHAPPSTRELWDWLLRTANHKAHKGIERGQLLTSYSLMIEGLSWKVGASKRGYKKHHIATSLKWLSKRTMIQTAKTTRGMIITIVLYDLYQNPKNYETNAETYTESIPETNSKRSMIYKNERMKEEEKEQEGLETPFDRFYEAYPGKKNFLRAAPEWVQNGCTEIADQIMEGLEAQIIERKLLAKHGEFVPQWKNADNWLKDKRWGDTVKTEAEIITEAKGGDPNSEYYEGLNAGKTDVGKCDNQAEKDEYIRTREGKPLEYMRGYMENMK